ncbi:hypothetical protein KI387_009058, partial [Taxus chinensis]
VQSTSSPRVDSSRGFREISELIPIVVFCSTQNVENFLRDLLLRASCLGTKALAANGIDLHRIRSTD